MFPEVPDDPELVHVTAGTPESQQQINRGVYDYPARDPSRLKGQGSVTVQLRGVVV